MLYFYKSHFFFFYTSTCTCACTHAHAYVEVSQLNKFANSFGPELSWAEMITERSDPESKTLFMLLANIAQSELANQIPTVNNNMAAAIARKIMRFR